MSKDDSSSGLLSKMVKFVRNPATSWSELDSIQADKEDSVSKQLLKEMIERKRQNDFVRKREFDMLRKMRRQESAAGPSHEPAGTPSFFQSSMVSRPDDRATTLKKIDEIEAQMSMQWWKTKNQTTVDHLASQRTPSSKADPLTKNPLLENALPGAYRPTVPASLSSRTPGPAAVKSATLDRAPVVPVLHPAPIQVPSVEAAEDSRASMFSPSRSAAVGVQEMVAHDAELEEAALHFANGEDASAEAGLLQILAPGAARENHMESWLTLFDLYRATGEQSKFETAAIEFIARFDRSAPQWFSLPEVVKAMGGTVQRATQGPAADWICPSVMGLQTVAALRAAVSRAAMPWRLDWNNLKTIEVPAVEPLYKVFSLWAKEAVQLRFMGDTQLQKVLAQATPSGDRNTDQSWWLLRLEALRVTNRPDDFELAALDFCVTYEVSPPAWESPRCHYKALDQQGDLLTSPTVIGEPADSSLHSGFHSQSMSSAAVSSPSHRHPLTIELSGEVLGDATAVLDKLDSTFASTTAEVMNISCAKLIRMDFSAAGTLLNWVSLRQAENRSVKFSDVNRLVASFFHVIGITEHARVQVRSD